jgi:hypothetical protein
MIFADIACGGSTCIVMSAGALVPVTALLTEQHRGMTLCWHTCYFQQVCSQQQVLPAMRWPADEVLLLLFMLAVTAWVT